MAGDYSTCRNCGNLQYLNSNNLCPTCASRLGSSGNPPPKWGTCTKCGKLKPDVNIDGVCGSCNTWNNRGW